MIALTPSVLAAVFAIASAPIARTVQARASRRKSISVAFTATLLAAALPVLFSHLAPGGTPHGLLAVAPFITALIALVAFGLAPLATHGSATFGRMMLLFAVAEAFLATSHPLVLLALWAASAGIAWFDFRTLRGTSPWHRLFGVYQLVSLLCFSAGAFLLWQGSNHVVAVALVLVGIFVREGVVPLHSWFPRFVEFAPMGIVVGFVAPQLGIYAHLELLSQIDIGSHAHVIARFGAATAVLAAMLGVVQLKARRSLAYLIMSQTGLVAFGLESHSNVGLAGALLNWQVLAIATSGFAMALATLEARRGTISLSIPAGNFAQTPRLATAFLILGLASVGFPLTLGFIAEDLLVQGTVTEYPYLGLSLVVATAFNGISVMRMFFMLFTGKRSTCGEPDLTRREAYVFALAAVVLLTFGLVPAPLVSYENPHDPTHSTSE